MSLRLSVPPAHAPLERREFPHPSPAAAPSRPYLPPPLSHQAPEPSRAGAAATAAAVAATTAAVEPRQHCSINVPLQIFAAPQSGGPSFHVWCTPAARFSQPILHVSTCTTMQPLAQQRPGCAAQHMHMLIQWCFVLHPTPHKW